MAGHKVCTKKLGTTTFVDLLLEKKQKEFGDQLGAATEGCPSSPAIICEQGLVGIEGYINSAWPLLPTINVEKLQCIKMDWLQLSK